VTAKYANHAKKEADWEFPSRIWRISRLNLFAPRRRPLSDLCVPVVKIRATTPRCPVSFRQQSQFPPAVTIPISSASMAGVPESEMRKTNPIWRCAVGGQRPNVRHRLDAPLRETNPNLGGLGYLGTGTRGAYMQNKPNFPPEPGGTRGKCAKQTQSAGSCHAKQSQFPPSGGCTNKPNLARSRHHPPFQHSNATSIVRNKPNSSIADSGQTCGGTSAGDCAKQTQFPACRGAGAARSRQTNPISRPCRGWGEAGGAWDEGQMRETDPICRELPCKTKPIPARWWLYKQTQFRPVGIPTIPLLHHSGIPARGQSCETDPIRPVGPGPAGRNARNKPNSGPDRFGPCLCVQTNPIPGRCPRGAL
jgi:hypothetical protein